MSLFSTPLTPTHGSPSGPNHSTASETPPQNKTTTTTPASKLRALLSTPSTLVVAPGVYDGISARLALSVGFPALYMTGAGTSMSRLGWADLGLATQTDMVAQAEMLSSLDPSVPLIADADTGYGGPVMISRTVRKYAAAGVAALHIEDQVQEKRCGHLLGKELVSKEVFWARLRAAVQTREKYGLDILIIARTDARQSFGFDEAYQRLKGAVECGVDAVFPEAMTSKEEAREMVERMGTTTPCLLNMVSGGVTPDMSADEAREIGYRLMIFPAITLEPAMLGMREALKRFKEVGRQPETKMGIREMFEVCGLQECMELDAEAGGKAYKGV